MLAPFIYLIQFCNYNDPYFLVLFLTRNKKEIEFVNPVYISSNIICGVFLFPLFSFFCFVFLLAPFPFPFSEEKRERPRQSKRAFVFALILPTGNLHDCRSILA